MAKSDDDESLKRLGGGRWQTRDERFTIEPQSGTWAVVDAEQTDELGLPLVRGPFPSLTAAKAAIAAARSGAPPAPAAKSRAATSKDTAKPSRAEDTRDDAASAPPAPKAGKERPTKARATKDRPVADDEAPPDPSWFGALEPDDRRRARRLLRYLTAQGVRDAEGLVRRDLAGDVSALATHAVKAALEALGPDASPAEVARLLIDGRDEALEVRWRLVDDRGRRIDLDR
jgi:hypothetical protein